jgi:hypothetical protein
MATTPVSSGLVGEDLGAQARRLAAESIGIDGHIDTIQRVLVRDPRSDR